MLECLDAPSLAANILASCSLGRYAETSAWKKVKASLFAPPASRAFRVRMRYVRGRGRGAEGYFDQLMLTANQRQMAVETTKSFFN